MIDSYMDIHRRFVGESESLNTEWQQYQTDLNNGIFSENPILPLVENSLDYEIEFNNFIAEFNKFVKKSN